MSKIMIQPLQQGDKVAIIASSGKIAQEKLDFAIQLFDKWGLKVELGKHLFEESMNFAGTDAQRKMDLQWALDDPEIKAVFFARGGYGLVRIIDSIDFTKFKNNPKWVCGYSDVTVFHNHVHSNLSIPTIHGSMPINFESNTEDSLTLLHKILFGGDIEYQLNSIKSNKEETIEGVFVGGNLSVFYGLIGTNSDVDTNGKILFLEEIGESLYHIDRMMWSLKKAGKLSNLAGLILGQFSDLKLNETPYFESIDEIFGAVLKNVKYPIIYDFPLGHVAQNIPVIIGQQAQISVTKYQTTIKYLL